MPVSDGTYRTAAPPERLTARMSQILRCSAVSASCFLNKHSSYLPLSHKYRDVNYGIFTWEGSHLKEKYICWSADKCVMMLERLIEAHFTPCWARVHDGSSVTLTDLRRVKVYTALMTHNMLQESLEFFLHVLSSETQFSVAASPALRVGVKLEAIPAVFRAEAGSHPGQVAGLSQGHTERQTATLTHAQRPTVKLEFLDCLSTECF